MAGGSANRGMWRASRWFASAGSIRCIFRARPVRGLRGRPAGPAARQGGGGRTPFTGENSLGNLVLNLLLLQGTGIAGQLTWNGPSWSISSEFFAYLFFAGIVLAAGRRGWLALCAMVVAGPLILAAFSPTRMDTTYHLGLVRCLYGFSAGALLAWFLHDTLVGERRWPQAARTASAGPLPNCAS